MTDSLLETLPFDLLCRIAEFLHAFPGRNLGAFALACSTCQAAADCSLFSNLQLEANDVEQLKSRFTTVDQILRRRNAYKHVRSLRVALVAPREEPRRKKPDHVEIIDPDHLDLIDKDDVLAEKSGKRIQAWPLSPQLLSSPESQVATAELNALIKHLSGLRDLHHDLPVDFACSTLEILKSKARSCHIHLYNFQSRYHLKENDQDLPELHLLTSPLLRSIESFSCGYGPDDKGDFTHEAIFELLHKCNPALRHVSMMTNVNLQKHLALVPAGYARRRPWGKPRGAWAGLQATRAVQHPLPAHLRSFELGGGIPVPLEWIRKMMDQCDLTAMETLKLYMMYNDSALCQFSASTAKFAALSTLVLGLRNDWLAHSRDEKQEGAAAAFLANLNPLKNLRFIEEIDADIFDVTLSHHGQSLQRLWFPLPQKKLFERFFTQTRLEKLSKSCPILEDLAIPIARSKGDGREVAMYKTLGSLPMLRRLALTLDCEDTSLTLRVEDRSPPPPDPSFDEFDNMMAPRGWGGGFADERWDVRNGDVRDAMINAALDERLARNIFARIQSAKPEGARPLKRLELRPERGYYVAGCQRVLRHLGRWWLVTQGARNKVNAIRLRDFADKDIERCGPMQSSVLGELEPIFRRIWPQNANSGGNWTEEWYSWPLAD